MKKIRSRLKLQLSGVSRKRIYCRLQHIVTCEKSSELKIPSELSLQPVAVRNCDVLLKL